MPLVRRNNPTEENKFAITGRQIDIALKGDTNFTDMGLIDSLTRGGNTDTQELKGNRTGRRTTYKKVILEDTAEWTFTTASYADRDVQRVLNGGTVITTGTGATAIMTGEEGKKVAYGCSMFTLIDTDSDFAIVRAFPSVSVEPDNDQDIQGFAGLQGRITVLSADDFTPPITLGNYDGRRTPSGVWYMTTATNVDEVPDALADALLAYMNANEEPEA